MKRHAGKFAQGLNKQTGVWTLIRRARRRGGERKCDALNVKRHTPNKIHHNKMNGMFLTVANGIPFKQNIKEKVTLNFSFEFPKSAHAIVCVRARLPKTSRYVFAFHSIFRRKLILYPRIGKMQNSRSSSGDGNGSSNNNANK